MATPASGQGRSGTKRSRKQRPRIDQISPITIGGGSSVSIGFNHKRYLGANGKYSKPGDEIHTAQIYDRYTSINV